MPEAVIIVAVVAAAAVQTTLQVTAAADAKKKAKRAEKLRLERLELEAQERAIQEERNKLALEAEARRKRAEILNAGFISGQRDSSVLRGGLEAITAAERREAGFQTSVSDIADQADEITQSQIRLDTQTAIQNATNSQISAIVGGVSTIASAGLGSLGGSSGSNIAGFNSATGSLSGRSPDGTLLVGSTGTLGGGV